MEDPASHPRSVQLSVLFADIAGSSLMYSVRGNTVAAGLATACLDLMEVQVNRQGGRLIKRLGDAILAVCDTTEAAVAAARGIQEALDAPGTMLRREGIHVRIGVSRGPVVVTDGDVYGDVVNVAARILSHAGTDEVCISGPAYEDLPAELRGAMQLIDQAVLRGRPDWVMIYKYLWKREDATIFTPVPLRPTTGILRLAYGSRALVIGPERPRLRIGRALDNDIAIDEEIVSRYHADISLRGDKFVLSDSSTNGTYVRHDNGKLVRVSREDLTLDGSGQILPGSAGANPIYYEITVKD